MERESKPNPGEEVDIVLLEESERLQLQSIHLQWQLAVERADHAKLMLEVTLERSARAHGLTGRFEFDLQGGRFSRATEGSRA